MAQLRATKRFSVDEYYAMARAGILGEDDRVELIEGEIVEMPPIGSTHASVVDRMAASLWRAVSERAVVRVQNPIRLNDLSEPVPDLVLLRPRDDFYRDRHPRPDEVILLIEVMDSSAPYDRAVKAPLYARAGIPELWLVDLNTETIEVLREPSADGYRQRAVFHRGETVTDGGELGLAISVEDALG